MSPLYDEIMRWGTLRTHHDTWLMGIIMDTYNSLTDYEVSQADYMESEIYSGSRWLVIRYTSIMIYLDSIVTD
jgi:hypothetical protein